MRFAEKLASLMACADGGAGIGQQELRRRSGVPQPTISVYLRGVNHPSWAHVQSLAKALGVSTDALVDDPPDPAPLPPVARIVSKRK